MHGALFDREESLAFAKREAVFGRQYFLIYYTLKIHRMTGKKSSVSNSPITSTQRRTNFRIADHTDTVRHQSSCQQYTEQSSGTC